jgi:hypothetical protein
VRAADLGLALASLLFAGCAAHAPPAADARGEVLYDGTLQELVPHHDGDEFVYRISGTAAPDLIFVQRVSAPADGGDVLVTLSQDGRDDAIAVATNLRDDGHTLWIVREELRQMDLVLVYTEPLPYLAVPVRAGVTETSSAVTLKRLSTGEVLGEGRAHQRLTIARGPAARGPDVIALGMERRLEMGNRTMNVKIGTWLKPGVGAIISEGANEGSPITRQELVCATVAGRRIGDCPHAGDEPAD